MELTLLLGHLVGGALCIIAAEDDVRLSAAQSLLFLLKLDEGKSFSGNALAACAVSIYSDGTNNLIMGKEDMFPIFL